MFNLMREAGIFLVFQGERFYHELQNSCDYDFCSEFNGLRGRDYLVETAIQNGRHDLAACDRYIYHVVQKFFDFDSEYQQVTESTKISEVINNSLFGSYGRLIFPVHTALINNILIDKSSPHAKILTLYDQQRGWRNGRRVRLRI